MRILLIVCTVLLVAEIASAQCLPGWALQGGKCMLCVTLTKTAAAASTDCVTRGGNLASILNSEQQTYAANCALAVGNAADQGVYFGLESRIGGFAWHDGSAFTAPPPPVAVPAAAVAAQNCFHIGIGAVWVPGAATTPLLCSTLRAYVCSRSATTCQVIVPPEDGGVTYSTTTLPYYSGTVATYNCSSGYSMVGGISPSTCQDDGTWGGDPPECSPLECPPLAVPANGGISAPTTSYNSVATYSCNAGYTLGSVSPSRTCQADKSWSGSAFTCSPVSCGTPATPENGDVNAATTTYGSVATYSCNNNYDLEGSATRTCMATGTWSGEEPTCDNTMAVALGATFGALALIGIIGGLIYCLCRASGPTLPRGPYPRPAPYRGTPGYPRPGPPRGPVPPRGRPTPGRLY